MALETKLDRFPRPEFENLYQFPDIQNPVPRTEWWLALDAIAMTIALAVSIVAIFRFRKHARWIQIGNGVACLAYFGFFRKGCICPVGSVQNTVHGLIDPSYQLPLLALLFFIMPVAAALFRGRVFCGSVCPFGAIQELVNVRPIRVPWLADRLLGLIPPLFFITAVFAAATGLGYLICRTDPFIGVFRFGAALPVAFFGVALLGLGVFVNRPYCRWLCPYGWILGRAAACARRGPRLAASGCSGCGLCGRSCRVDAIHLSVRKTARPAHKRLIPLLTLAAFLASGLAIGFGAGPFLASIHPDIALKAKLESESAGLLPHGSSPETKSFYSSGQSQADFMAQAAKSRESILAGSVFWGMGCALVLAGAWWKSRRWATKSSWSIDAGRCVACGRCMAACPQINSKEAIHG